MRGATPPRSVALPTRRVTPKPVGIAVTRRVAGAEEFVPGDPPDPVEMPGSPHVRPTDSTWLQRGARSSLTRFRISGQADCRRPRRNRPPRSRPGTWRPRGPSRPRTRGAATAGGAASPSSVIRRRSSCRSDHGGSSATTGPATGSQAHAGRSRGTPRRPVRVRRGRPTIRPPVEGPKA